MRFAWVSCSALLVVGCYQSHPYESSDAAATDADSGPDASADLDVAPEDLSTPADMNQLSDVGTVCTPAPESCANGRDEDCDGATDEVVETISCGVGLCVNEGRSCDESQPARCVPRPPQPERCNGLDDDCDGTIDVIDRGADGVPDCLNILLVGQSGSQDAGTFEQWLRTNGASSTRILTSSSERLTARLIANADVLILDRLTREYTAAEARILADWVRAGGGLMAVTGHYNEPPTVDRANSLLADVGLRYAYTSAVIDTTLTVVEPHPAVERVRRVPVFGGFPVIASAPTARIVGRDRFGLALVGVNELGSGRVYLFADEWVMFNSQWDILGEDLRRFWSSALRWLGQTRRLPEPTAQDAQ